MKDPMLLSSPASRLNQDQMFSFVSRERNRTISSRVLRLILIGMKVGSYSQASHFHIGGRRYFPPSVVCCLESEFVLSGCLSKVHENRSEAADDSQKFRSPPVKPLRRVTKDGTQAEVTGGCSCITPIPGLRSQASQKAPPVRTTSLQEAGSRLQCQCN